jgi:hypothetical protein
MRKHRLIGIVVALTIVGGAIAARPSGAQTSNTSYRTAPRGAATQYETAGSTLARFVADVSPQASAPDSELAQSRAQILKGQQFLADYAKFQAQQQAQAQVAAAAAAAAAQRAAAAAQAAQAARAAANSSAAGSPGVWAELRQCESGGNYAENTGNGYYGAYQFSLSTWESLGYSGLPSDAPPAVQDQAAQQAQARGGWGQWPACSRKLGL